MAFGVKWECPNCHRIWTSGSFGDLKREVKEALEDGIEVKCLECETEVMVDESNAEVKKI